VPGRRIAVGLDLEAAPYINEAGKVLTTTKAMNAEMGALDREVDKVDRDMAELAVTTEAAKRQVDDLGDKARGSAADLSLLDARIKATKASVRELGLEFARTGDKALFKDIGAGERDLRRMQKILANATGPGVTNNFGEQLSGAFGGTRATGPLIAILVGAAAAAAPTIGAMLGGAIAGAAGTGAMAAGILSAIKDPKVQDAAGRFGKDISAEFFASGDAFVDPILKSLDILQKGFGDLHLGDQLAKVAPDVEVIAQGFADAGREFMEGFGPALDRMGPLADIAGKGIADFGEALGEALDNITASKGTVEGLETLLSLITGTIRGLGVGLGWLGDRFHDFNVVAAHGLGDLEDIYKKLGLSKFAAGAARLNDIFERITGTGENLHGVLTKIGNPSTDPFADYLHHSWEEMARLHAETEATRKAMVDYFDTLQGQLDANLAWEQAIDDLTKSVQENGRTLDIHTEKGRNNIRAVEEGLTAARRQYQQGQITGAQYDQQIQKLIEIGVQAGLSRKALEELAKQYQIEIFVKMYGAAIMQGAATFLTGAVSRLWGSGTGTTSTGTGRPVGERAAGGSVMAGVPYTINERGNETVTFPASGTVHPASLSPAQPWSGGASGGARYVIENNITLIDPMTGQKTRGMLITDARNRGKPADVVAAAYP
jgi:hypothetical protein